MHGILQDGQRLGELAVELVHNAAMRFDYGLPAMPYSVRIPGVWVEGKSLRPLPDGCDPMNQTPISRLALLNGAVPGLASAISVATVVSREI